MKTKKELKWDLLNIALSMLPPKYSNQKEYGQEGYEHGWTDAMFYMMGYMGVLEEWTKTLRKDIADKIIELNDHSALFIYCGDTPFFHEEKSSLMFDPKDIKLSVNCGDFFSICCAESEECTIDDIEEIYSMYKDKKYHGWGERIWVALKRKECPHRIAWDEMKKDKVDINLLKEIGYWERIDDKYTEFRGEDIHV